MIQMYCARTLEIDEPEKALQELLNQIDLDVLLKNSVGIISCNHEFISNGVVSYLCEKLPFEVIGLTTLVTLVNGEYDQYSLGLTVLTSDEVSFKTITSKEINADNYNDVLTDACFAEISDAEEEPSFILTVFPYLRDVSGSQIMNHLNIACKGIPIWGTVASDDAISFDYTSTIINGVANSSTVVMILMYGPVNPKFTVAALPERNISTRKAVVTSSDGYRIYTVNDMPTKDYFEQIGIALKDGPDALAVPIIIDYGDGSKPIASAVFKIFPDGSGLTSVEAPQGSTFSLGEVDYEGIIETAEESLRNALEVENATGMLMFPCVTRYMMSSPSSEGEMCLVVEKIGNKFPYMLAYSGGELCPVPGIGGSLCNRYHNYTFVACVFS